MRDNISNQYTSLFDISRLLNNVSNNYDDAFTSYTDVKMFMQEPQVVEEQYPADSYRAGYSTGRILYYMLFTEEYAVGTVAVDPFTTLSNYDPAEYAYVQEDQTRAADDLFQL